MISQQNKIKQRKIWGLKKIGGVFSLLYNLQTEICSQLSLQL